MKADFTASEHIQQTSIYCLQLKLLHVHIS